MKTWQKPQLIVLVRNRPEEAILTFCKGDSSGTGSQSTNLGCWGAGPEPLAGFCGVCNTAAGS